MLLVFKVDCFSFVCVVFVFCFFSVVGIAFFLFQCDVAVCHRQSNQCKDPEARLRVRSNVVGPCQSTHRAPDIALAPDISGVCRVDGTLLINSKPKKMAKIKTNNNNIKRLSISYTSL